MSGFSHLGLSEPLLRALQDLGYEQPTQIQEQAIPLVLQGGDILAGAQTGTGKTAGFTLPMLERLKGFASTSMSPARHPVRGLVLTPTRELAMQVEESIRAYGKYLPFRTAVIYGGVNIKDQHEQLRRGVDLLVATPGRLLDHLEQKTVNLSQVQICVLDEADRMLDMGFILDIRRILSAMPASRQSLLFSATFSDEIRKLADTMLKQPTLIEVARRNAVNEAVTQTAYEVPAERKGRFLVGLVRHLNLTQALVFTRTKQNASRLSSFLSRAGIAAAAIHGDKTQQARTQALEDFKQGKVQVLVATDVAARGIDIDQLPCVINYELPHVPEDYVHRIGRTGRGGATGEAISLIGEDESRLVADIEKVLKKKLERRPLPEFETRPAREPREPHEPREPRARPAAERRRPAPVCAEPDAAPQSALVRAPLGRRLPPAPQPRRRQTEIPALLRKFPDPQPDQAARWPSSSTTGASPADQGASGPAAGSSSASQIDW